MKVAITSTGDTPQDRVDLRFGRAQKFVIMNTEEDGFQAVDNSRNLNAAQGAGIQAAQNVVNAGVGAIVTGHCGPKAYRALTAARVEIYLGAEGTVKEMFEKYKRGELEKAAGSDVDGHW